MVITTKTFQPRSLILLQKNKCYGQTTFFLNTEVEHCYKKGLNGHFASLSSKSFIEKKI